MVSKSLCIRRIFSATLAMTAIGAMTTRTNAQTVTPFFSSFASGENPSFGTLLYDPTANAGSGALIGTTGYGGANGNGDVFSSTLTGHITTLYSFSALTGSLNGDGANPIGGVINYGGNYYGTTQNGGTGGFGDIYEYNTTSHSLTDLYNFTTSSNPMGELAVDKNGVLFGTASNGGAFYNGYLFSYATGTSTFSDLYDLGTGVSDGVSPQAGVAVVNNTNGSTTIYGTTISGGTGGSGQVYAYNTLTGYQDVYDFGSIINDGSGPTGGLVIDGAGNIFGTTNGGGAYSGGTVFEISNTDTYSQLYSVNDIGAGGTGTDGYNPVGTLVDMNGTLVGVNESGAAGYGDIFTLTPTYNPLLPYNYADIFSFNGGSTGGVPLTGVTALNSYAFAGTNVIGGDNAVGVLFVITPEPGSLSTMAMGTLAVFGIGFARRRRLRR